MRVLVDQEACIACGDCISLCPEVFDWDDNGYSHVIVETVPPELEACAKEALETCPSEAIHEK